MKKNETTPLDELRKEKTQLKAECAEREERLAEFWEYVNDNAGYLLINSVVDAFKRKIGLTQNSPKNEKGDNQDTPSGISGIMNMFKSGIHTAYPLIWDIAQPLVWDFALGKIKSLFKFKKKKKNRAKYYDDEED